MKEPSKRRQSMKRLGLKRLSVNNPGELRPLFRNLPILLVLTLALGGTAMAQMTDEDEILQERSSQRIERLAERLGLSEGQKETITKIHEEGQQERIALRKESLRLRNELHGELLKDEPSESTVLNLVERIGEVRIQQQQSRLTQQLAVRKQLTPDQRDKFLLMGERRHEKGRGRGHHSGRRAYQRSHHHSPDAWGGKAGVPRRDGF